MSNYIDEAAAAIEKFCIERTTGEVRQIFEKVYQKIKTANYRQEYSALLREYATALTPRRTASLLRQSPP